MGTVNEEALAKTRALQLTDRSLKPNAEAIAAIIATHPTPTSPTASPWDRGRPVPRRSTGAALAIWSVACNHALEIGTPDAYRLANRTAKAVGLAPPFGNLDLLLTQFAKPFGEALGKAKRIEDAEVIAVGFLARIFRRSYHGVRWDDAKRDDVYKAVRGVLVRRGGRRVLDRRMLAHRNTYEKALRATFRVLGGSASVAKNLLRARVEPSHEKP